MRAGAVVNDGSLVASAVRRPTLSTEERAELFALLSTYFVGVTPAQFARDLDEKDWVLRIRRGGQLVGFTTLQCDRTTFEGQSLNVIYSGDTITDPSIWRSSVLARGWIALVREIQGACPHERWYWLLLSSGFRTYRFLPVFWRDFWPRHDREMPPSMSRLLDHLARQRFGDRASSGSGYCADTGIVRFAHPQRLRGALAELPEGKRTDPHVAFFLTRNRGHADGDELVCLTDLGDHNLTAAGARMVRGRAP